MHKMHKQLKTKLKMENKNLLIVLPILALLLGGLLTYTAFPQKVEVEKQVEVEKLVNVTVDKIVNVPLDFTATYITPAMEEFMKEVDDDEDLQVCNSDEFSMKEISLKKLSDVQKVTVDDDKTTVEFGATLKYKQDEVKACYNAFAVTVTFEEDEKPVVVIA
jgi:hypothetical protein